MSAGRYDKPTKAPIQRQSDGCLHTRTKALNRISDSSQEKITGSPAASPDFYIDSVDAFVFIPMGLSEELKMNKPFISQQHELTVGLLFTAERLRDYFLSICQRYGITTQQYNMLRILRGSHPNALSCSEVNSRMIQRSPDITRLIRRLELGGYVTRARDSRDNRIVRTLILPSGLTLLESMDADIRAMHDVFSVLSDEQRAELVNTLQAVRAELNRRMPL